MTIRLNAGFRSQSDSLSRLLEQLIGLVRRQFLLIVVIIAFTTAIGVVYLMTHAGDLYGTRQADNRQQ